MKIDLDKMLPAAKIKGIAKELATVKESSLGTKNKHCWDISEATDEAVDPNKPDTGEWSKEALEASAPKKCHFCWDATPANVAVSETPDGIRCLW